MSSCWGQGWGWGRRGHSAGGFFKAWMTRLKWGWEAWHGLREERARHRTEAKQCQCP